MALSTPRHEGQQALEARDRAVVRACGPVAAGLVALTLAYATTRYVVFGPWSVGHIPIYVLSKSLAWTSLTLLGLALSLGPLARLWPGRFLHLRWQRKYYGLLGFALATAHILLSLTILNYGYYRGMFQQAFELTPIAELSLSAGALCWTVLLVPLAFSIPDVQRSVSPRAWLRGQACARVALLLGGIHVVYGAPAWLTPATWFGGMPPITMICALTVLAVIALRLAARLFGTPTKDDP